MTVVGSSAADIRFLGSGEEAGTAPGDRRFRPDVEGLRTVAVVLVVLFHAGLARVTGGFVGVDVFFVISGFVITGLLLRERQGTGGTSILDFYARRCRRILPAATLVILVTVAASYFVLGVLAGNSAANDGRWAAVFLANVHFQATGTNYFTSIIPPSPLQNYWSLSVEEQFYVVYPTLFLLVARAARLRLSLQARLTILLGLIITVSFWLSITQTASDQSGAYFSPFTRAWELALGGLIAVGTPLLRRVPAKIASGLTWAGLAAILFAAFTYSTATLYPSWRVAVPVLGSALIIAGGVVAPRNGAELLLGRQPFQWLGRRSYSLYLWHWPILIIAAERVDKTSLPAGESLLLVGLAIVVSAATYRVVENPIRHWKLPSPASVGAGLLLVVTTVVVLSLTMFGETSPVSHAPVVPVVSEQAMARQLVAATRLTGMPQNLQPALTQASSDWGGYYVRHGKQGAVSMSCMGICRLGDQRSHSLMVVYGDSHAIMWLPAFNTIAKRAHWRLVILGRFYCPAIPVTIVNPPGTGSVGSQDTACDAWHVWATKWIDKHKPKVLVLTEASGYTRYAPAGQQSASFTATQWQHGLTTLFHSFSVPGMREVLLGNSPFDLSVLGPSCLAVHTNDVQACSAPVHQAVLPLTAVERSTAHTDGIQYIDPITWMCTSRCTAIINHYVVYFDGNHISATWAKYMRTLLGDQLALPPATP